jgi:hypothetical protein
MRHPGVWLNDCESRLPVFKLFRREVKNNIFYPKTSRINTSG